MITREYVEVVVVPTVREALAERADRRRAYLSCIATFHVLDYLAAPSRGLDFERIKSDTRAACPPSFDVVQGIANGSKHAGGKSRQWVIPGTERDIPIFALDSPGTGWGQGRLGVPGLGVMQGDIELMIDWCVQVLLVTMCTMNEELSDVDLSWMDPAILESQPSRSTA